MLILDYITANQDRHTGNFGVIRNADTLEYTGFAPIYDSGTGLRYDTPTEDIVCDMDIESQPFAPFHNEQIKLVSDRSLFVPERLEDIGADIDAVFSDKRAERYISPQRAEIIREVVKARIRMLSARI